MEATKTCREITFQYWNSTRKQMEFTGYQIFKCFLNGCWILELTGVSAFAFLIFFWWGGKDAKFTGPFCYLIKAELTNTLKVEELRYWRYLEINWKQPIPQEQSSSEQEDAVEKKSQDESAQCISNRKKLPICWVSLSIFWQSTDKASIKYLLGKFLFHTLIWLFITATYTLMH